MTRRTISGTAPAPLAARTTICGVVINPWAWGTYNAGPGTSLSVLLLDVADHADDLAPRGFRLGGLQAEPDAFPERVLAGKVLPREGLVDDDGSRRGVVVRDREFAALTDRDAHGPKVSRADERKSGTEARAGFGGAIGGQLEAEPIARAAQRQRPDNRRARRCPAGRRSPAARDRRRRLASRRYNGCRAGSRASSTTVEASNPGSARVRRSRPVITSVAATSSTAPIAVSVTINPFNHRRSVRDPPDVRSAPMSARRSPRVARSAGASPTSNAHAPAISAV